MVEIVPLPVSRIALKKRRLFRHFAADHVKGARATQLAKSIQGSQQG